MNQTVFANRTLNMKKIKWIGLDMDHTLIRYKTENFEDLVYKLIIEELIANKHYPAILRTFVFNFDAAIRGLVIDCRNGNILKLSRYGAIRTSYHGTRQIDFVEQKKFYRSTYVDLSDHNYIAIDTAFSIAFCVLYGQLVDLKEDGDKLPGYDVIAQDVLAAVDTVHANGQLKNYIGQHLDEFVIKDPELVEGLLRYVRYGKKFFILTNSEYYYTKLLLDYAINPFLPEGKTWAQLFDFVITLSNKPRFFYDNYRFLAINPHDGTMSNIAGHITPGIYQGGNARQFTGDLSLNGDEILYIGDHIYGDILRLKKDCNWRTALVVEELSAEIKAQKNAGKVEALITETMLSKISLEHDFIALQTKIIDEDRADLNSDLQQLQVNIAALDSDVVELLKKQQAFYNSKWERVFRAGAEESYFAYQVERYACIYMEKLSSLLLHSPLYYFRAQKRALAHD